MAQSLNCLVAAKATPILPLLASRATKVNFLILHPFSITETHERGGFFVHGGMVLGSASCIDLTSHIEKLVSELSQEGAMCKCQIHLTVSYKAVKA